MIPRSSPRAAGAGRTRPAMLLTGMAVLAAGAALAATSAGAGATARAGATAGADTSEQGDTAQPAAAGQLAVAPFFAHYIADWHAINVGVSDLELKADTVPGRYVYTWTLSARGVFRLMYSNDVVQKSTLELRGDHVRPLEYQAGDGAATVNLEFDWDALRARGSAENQPVDLKLTQATQDILSSQVEVMLDLKNGTLPDTFRIIDKNEAKDFEYTQEGGARLRTALGMLDTVVVASRRRGNDRVLRMWFAPSLGYVPVQAERSRGGKLEFAMRIKTLKR